MHMPDSRLNGTERALQHPFRKRLNLWPNINGLVVFGAVLASFAAIDRLPDRQALPRAELPLAIWPVRLLPPGGPLRLAGAWQLSVADPRFGGISALAIDGDRFLAASDLGAIIRFDRPGSPQPTAEIADLGEGPGPFGSKWARDAESLAPDPQGRGWWVGYEQRHSLWLYDFGFRRAYSRLALDQFQWRDNRGAEALLAERDGVLALGENGRDALLVRSGNAQRLRLQSGADIADAARSTDGRGWVLLREKTLVGIRQSIAPLERTGTGYRVGRGWPVPKDALDNFEGMAVEALPGGGLRFWLVSDDGHRIMARTLVVALDYLPPRHDKSPATGAGLSKKPAGNTRVRRRPKPSLSWQSPASAWRRVG